jgi:hypothetical protein
MLDRFKDFFRKRQTKVPEVTKVPVEFDSEYLVNFTNDIILSLNDINGVSVKKQSTSVDVKNFETFIIKYRVKISDDIDLTNLKLELLNCKSHLQSEDLILRLEGVKKLLVPLNVNKSTIVDRNLDFDNFDRDGRFSHNLEIDYNTGIVNNGPQLFNIIVKLN